MGVQGFEANQIANILWDCPSQWVWTEGSGITAEERYNELVTAIQTSKETEQRDIQSVKAHQIGNVWGDGPRQSIASQAPEINDS